MEWGAEPWVDLHIQKTGVQETQPMLQLSHQKTEHAMVAGAGDILEPLKQLRFTPRLSAPPPLQHKNLFPLPFPLTPV